MYVCQTFNLQFHPLEKRHSKQSTSSQKLFLKHNETQIFDKYVLKQYFCNFLDFRGFELINNTIIYYNPYG